MQTIHLLRKCNKIYGIDEYDYSKEAYEREKKIRLFDQLIAEGSKQVTALAALETSRSTIYRWKKRYRKYGISGLESVSRAPENTRTSCWSKELENHVLALRRTNILYGKYKIHTILKRDYAIKASVSTIGRIISSLIARNKIKPACFILQIK